MYAWHSRLNAIFFYAVSVLGVVALLSHGTSYFMPYSPSATMTGLNVKLQRSRSIGIEKSIISFNLYADLETAFNWNVKQLFVYVAIEYSTKKYDIHEVVIWDQIIQHDDPRIIDIQELKYTYPLLDHHGELIGQMVNMSLYIDQMPYIGLPRKFKITETELLMPKRYT